MVTSKKKEQKLSLDRLMNYISVFFFSTICMFASIFFYSFRLQNTVYNTAYLILGIIFFTGYFFLLFDLILFYLTKVNKWTKKSYKEHYLWFWGCAVLIFLIALGIGLFHFLEDKKFYEIIGGTAIMASFTILWKIIVKIYTKYFKKKS